MNGAALDQVNRHWNDICDELRALVPRHATLQQAFQVSLEVVSRPLLWSENRVPARVAAAYKACVGFCQVFAHLLLEDEAMGEQPLSAMGSGMEFANWVEQEGWLKGERQACAGSLRQIKTIFELFCSGDAHTMPPSEPLEAIALQTALVLSTYPSVPHQPAECCLGCRLLQHGRAPWLFAVTSKPGRTPDLARRFFPKRGRVGSLERFLAGDSPGLSHQAREQLFWEAIPNGG